MGSLLTLIDNHGFGDADHNEEYQPAVASACRALGTLLLHKANLFLIQDMLGLKVLPPPVSRFPPPLSPSLSRAHFALPALGPLYCSPPARPLSLSVRSSLVVGAWSSLPCSPPPLSLSVRNLYQKLVELGLHTEDMEVLRCVSMPICANVPTATERCDAHNEGGWPQLICLTFMLGAQSKSAWRA